MLAWLTVAILLPQEPRALVDLARQAVITEVRGLAAPKPTAKSPASGVFVTIEVGGKLRGCRGSLQPRTPTLEREVISAARGAAAHDPRYRPLVRSELARFTLTVTVVDSIQPIDSVQGLAPEDGLVLESGTRVGVVLPWEGKDPQVRLGWAYRKAGVAIGAPAKLSRLVARRYRG